MIDISKAPSYNPIEAISIHGVSVRLHTEIINQGLSKKIKRGEWKWVGVAPDDRLAKNLRDAINKDQTIKKELGVWGNGGKRGKQNAKESIEPAILFKTPAGPNQESTKQPTPAEEVKALIRETDSLIVDAQKAVKNRPDRDKAIYLAGKYGIEMDKLGSFVDDFIGAND